MFGIGRSRFLDYRFYKFELVGYKFAFYLTKEGQD